MKKKVSVIMGIYNCENTLQDAIDSIKSQTYDNWELIMCDDGSADSTYEIAKENQKLDHRIIVLCNNRNMGLNYSLNKCLSYAHGEYIARQDGDDISLPERFEKEAGFLDAHPEYGFVSCSMILFDENGEWGIARKDEKPTKYDTIKSVPVFHAPVMIRKSCLDEVGGYTVDDRMLRVEDVNLWIKLYASGYSCYNLQEPLYKMRNDKNALNRRKYIYRINSTYVRLKGCKELRLGFKYYLYAFNPMIVGLIPAKLRRIVRRKQWKP